MTNQHGRFLRTPRKIAIIVTTLLAISIIGVVVSFWLLVGSFLLPMVIGGAFSLMMVTSLLVSPIFVVLNTAIDNFPIPFWIFVWFAIAASFVITK